MIWKSKSGSHAHADGEEVWRKMFALWPRHIKGYWIWLEPVDAMRKYYHGAEGKADWWGLTKEYRLTEKQKVKLGITW